MACTNRSTFGKNLYFQLSLGIFGGFSVETRRGPRQPTELKRCLLGPQRSHLPVVAPRWARRGQSICLVIHGVQSSLTGRYAKTAQP